MNTQALELARVAIAGLSRKDRVALLSELVPNNAAAAPRQEVGPKILTRRAVAEMLSRSIRTVDSLAKSGALPRIRLPGRSRACGFTAESVERLLMAGGMA